MKRTLFIILSCFTFLLPIHTASGQGHWGDDPNSGVTWTNSKVGIGTSTLTHDLNIQNIGEATIGLNQSIISGTTVLGEGRIDFFPTPTSNYKASLTVVDRFGDGSQDLFFQLLPNSAINSSRWSMFEGWRGAGLYLGTGGGANPIAFAINREEVMRLDESGNLGIGTSTPTARLHVVGDAVVEGTLQSEDIDILRRRLKDLEEQLDKQDALIDRLIRRLVQGLDGRAREVVQELADQEAIIADITAESFLNTDSPNEEFLSAYPNPFNPATTFVYSLNNDTHVTLKVYNMVGQEIVTLVDEYQASGSQRIEWNGLDNSGQEVPSGTYLYKIIVDDKVQTNTVVLIK